MPNHDLAKWQDEADQRRAAIYEALMAVGKSDNTPQPTSQEKQAREMGEC